jgi:hypothetical protein
MAEVLTVPLPVERLCCMVNLLSLPTPVLISLFSVLGRVARQDTWNPWSWGSGLELWLQSVWNRVGLVGSMHELLVTLLFNLSPDDTVCEPQHIKGFKHCKVISVSLDFGVRMRGPALPSLLCLPREGGTNVMVS